MLTISRPVWYLAALITAIVLTNLNSGLAAENHQVTTPISNSPTFTEQPPSTQIFYPPEVLNTTEPLTSTETVSATITINPDSTSTPDPTTTPTIIHPVFAPVIIRQPTPTPLPVMSNHLYCANISGSKSIPDNYGPGISDVISIQDAGYLTDIDILLEIDHTWVGDLVVDLLHLETNQAIRLVDRPGYPSYDQGCPYDDIYSILDDEISLSVKNRCRISPAAISGIFIPEEPLSSFFGELSSGQWKLTISDHSKFDTGSLKNWCIAVDTSSIPISPPTPPPSISVPASAEISGINGQDQALPLDCESRSAVDWARYFGYHIDELAFFNQLPHSDNPDKGFVGNVYGIWGQIPPNPYGIHAEPVADLLRQYGLSAYAHRPLSWNQLRYEISQGRPVFVWIIGSVVNGIPIYYTPTDGLTTVVARYEHTVIVTGYSQTTVKYLNGDTIYSTSVDQFLESWSALGNMAITSTP